MHDLNLDEMMNPGYAAPVQSTGKLKVQIQFGDKALHVIIIEVRNNSPNMVPWYKLHFLKKLYGRSRAYHN